MADVHSQCQRSYNMSRIRSKDTKPEMLVRQWLHANGFRFRIHRKDLPGKPDVVLPKFRAIVMVHGCFWHAHEGNHCFKVPSTRTDWWVEKLNRNRDIVNQQALKEKGWRVFVIWECELKPSIQDITLEKLVAGLRSCSKRCKFLRDSLASMINLGDVCSWLVLYHHKITKP